MKTRRLVILFVIGLIALGASGCGYNTLTTKHENVKAKWANVETQLQRRGDLLTNLAEAAKMAGGSQQNIEPGFKKLAQLKDRVLTLGENPNQVADLFRTGSVAATVLGNLNGLDIPRERLNLE